MFLCLFAGGQAQALPKGLGTEDSQASNSHIQFSEKRFASFLVIKLKKCVFSTCRTVIFHMAVLWKMY